MLTTNKEPQTAANTQPQQSISKSARIRELNDAFRTSSEQLQPPQGRKLMTRGVIALGMAAVVEIAWEVMRFKDFNDANDPWGEHDFGSFTYEGHKIFWKIDYYDKNEANGSPDPADPNVTCRVLTVMLAEEW